MAGGNGLNLFRYFFDIYPLSPFIVTLTLIWFAVFQVLLAQTTYSWSFTEY